MWLYAGPEGGSVVSKKPDPLAEIPLTVTCWGEGSIGTVSGEALAGAAGGGAFSWMTRTPQEFVEFAYSWKVQKV